MRPFPESRRERGTQGVGKTGSTSHELLEIKHCKLRASPASFNTSLEGETKLRCWTACPDISAVGMQVAELDIAFYCNLSSRDISDLEISQSTKRLLDPKDKCKFRDFKTGRTLRSYRL